MYVRCKSMHAGKLYYSKVGFEYNIIIYSSIILYRVVFMQIIIYIFVVSFASVS